MDRETIVALSTPAGESGIAVIRLSGPNAIAIVESIAPGSKEAPSNLLVLRKLKDLSGQVLDEAMVAVMRAPCSFTGEDMVEISCHGGMQVVSDIIEVVLSLGARIAGHGEFSKRAFLNGKIDLAQAEAIADLIAAETKLQRRIALDQLEGSLSREVKECEDLLLEELALIEAGIDFCEEEIPIRTPRETLEAAASIRARIERLLAAEIPSNRLRKGLRVTIVGPRNAGKSSLYNALLGEERAIVSPIPGTTRDLIRERIHIGGFTCWLEDTAGLAETSCEIEARGVAIGKRAAEKSDLLLFVIDGSIELDANVERAIMESRRENMILIMNKKDLGLVVSENYLREKLDTNEIISVSATSGEGVDALRRLIYEKAIAKDAGMLVKERIAVNERHAAALREAAESLHRLEEIAAHDAKPELMSLELRTAADALGSITGRCITDELLDAIFSRFCIGK